jgi:uncharacterized protein YprB with RNaseH-like and TPR domain
MDPGRVTVVDSDALDVLTAGQLRDAIAATSPDLLVAASPGARVRLRRQLDEVDTPVVAPGADRAAERPACHRIGDAQLAVAGSTASLAGIAPLEAAGELDTTTKTYVLTDQLGLSIRPTELRAVREGAEAYRQALRDGQRDADRSLDGSYTHLSTELPAGYYGDWDGLTVRGARPGQLDGAPDGGAAGGSSDASIVALELGAKGTVARGEFRAASLGLRAIEAVGEQRAEILREAGYTDRAALASADVATIADRDGFSLATAPRIVANAQAFRDGRVRRTTAERLPGPEPIFVDVETDGLSPSTAWLIGVLDREGEPSYRSFLADDPDRPAAALESFCEWLAERQEEEGERPVVAYNGRTFDFPVLADLIERHCPRFRETWADTPTFDPYTWAVRDGNAVLPGRTNRLEDVAGALDVEPVGTADGTGSAPLSGAEVARIYRLWMAEPVPENEPNWVRLETYCEADVRSLAQVYDAIAAADRIEGERSICNVAAETTQGSLGDF